MPGTARSARARAAAAIGTTLGDYDAKRAAGLSWCSAHRQWHPVDAFGMTKAGPRRVCRQGRRLPSLTPGDNSAMPISPKHGNEQGGTTPYAQNTDYEPPVDANDARHEAETADAELPQNRVGSDQPNTDATTTDANGRKDPAAMAKDQLVAEAGEYGLEVDDSFDRRDLEAMVVAERQRHQDAAAYAEAHPDEIERSEEARS